jgi:hypothetical protein
MQAEHAPKKCLRSKKQKYFEFFKTSKKCPKSKDHFGNLQIGSKETTSNFYFWFSSPAHAQHALTKNFRGKTPKSYHDFKDAKKSIFSIFFSYTLPTSSV